MGEKGWGGGGKGIRKIIRRVGKGGGSGR